jgi:DNA-directed RNA polymerase specialized sigma24 family protein
LSIRLQLQVDEAQEIQRTMAEHDPQISEAVNREQARLRNFIRRRVPDPLDAEDILQE